MMVNLNTVQKQLLWLGIILFPFVNSILMNSGSGFSGSTIPLSTGVIIWIISKVIKGNVSINTFLHTGVYFFALWIIEAIVSSVLNFEVIAYSENIVSNGIEQFLFKLAAMLVYFFMAIYVYDITLSLKTDAVCNIVCKMLLISFAIAGLYSLVEILSMFDESLKPILLGLDAFFRGGDGGSVSFKVRSVSYEASTLGNYLAVVAPFILVKMINGKRKYIFVSIYLMIMALMTYSRTVYVVVFIDMLLISMFYKTWKYLLTLIMAVFTISAIISTVNDNLWFSNISLFDIFTSLIDSDDSGRITSNYMRYGSQVAAYGVWMDNIVFGVGLGQAKFCLLNYIPNWAWMSSDMFMFQDNMVVFGVYSRMLAEQGVVGLLLYSLLWGTVIYKLIKKCIHIKNDEEKMFVVALTVAIIGSLLTANNWDMLSYPANWVLLALAWRMCVNVDKRACGDA